MRYTYNETFETQLSMELLPAITVCAYVNKGYKGGLMSIHGNEYAGLRGGII